MITVRNLTKRFGSQVVLDGISLQIDRGETVALLGPSGSGKTTLLRCLNGLERFDSGDVEVDGIPLQAGQTGPAFEERLRQVRCKCGFVFQQYHLFPHKSILENVTLAPIKVRQIEREQAIREALDLLEQMGMRDKAHRLPSRCSGGEQQRAAIARALAMHPEYLLYDEPTSALDPERAQEIWSLIRLLAAKGQTQVIVTHQEELTRAISCRILRMREGRIVEG